MLLCLGKGIKIEHVGSTAVPDLGGKNILDIVIGSSKNTQKIKERLERLGYILVDDAGTPARLFFYKDTIYRKKRIRMHLHLVKFNGRDWREMVAFRNYLLCNKSAVKEYIKIKKQAVRLAHGNKEIYIKAKNRFIERVTQKALRQLRL